VTLSVYWRDQARADPMAIVEYVSARDPSAARRLRNDIMAAAATTAEHPYLYRPGRVAGTRELVAHPNDIVVYQVGDRVEVLNVLHARQQYPDR